MESPADREIMHIGDESSGTYVEFLTYVPWGLRKRVEMFMAKSVKGIDPETAQSMMDASKSEDPEKAMMGLVGKVAGQVGLEVVMEGDIMLMEGLMTKCIFKGQEKSVREFLDIIPEHDFKAVYKRISKIAAPQSNKEKKSL